MSKQQPEIWKKLLLTALEKHMGLVSPACREVGISRERHYHYYKTDDEYKAAVDDINEVVLDMVEGQLFKNIKRGSERSILFYMKYKGKKRGYTDNLDLTTNGESLNNVKIEIIRNKKDDDSLDGFED